MNQAIPRSATIYLRQMLTTHTEALIMTAKDV